MFSDSEVLQQELQKGLEEAKLPEQVPVDKNYALRMSKSMKIKTDTGIEIIVPAECLENNDYIEFVSNPDGKISISKKTSPYGLVFLITVMLWFLFFQFQQEYPQLQQFLLWFRRLSLSEAQLLLQQVPVHGPAFYRRIRRRILS